MTFEEDQAELARHEREILEHLSFNYAVLDAAESRLYGCIYIDPPERVGADADISWWLVTDADPVLEATLRDFVPEWIARGMAVHQPPLHRARSQLDRMARCLRCRPGRRLSGARRVGP